MGKSIPELRTELEDLKKKQVEAERDLNRYEAKYESLLDMLRSEFHVNSLEEAEAKRTALSVQIEKMTQDLGAHIAEIQKRLGVLP